MTINKNNGFTIVELMIATTVFSFVLLVATTGIIAIGRLYHKGITNSRTQEAARSVIEDVSRSLQFSSQRINSNLTGLVKSRCIGNDRYTYVIDQLNTGGAIGLWRDQRPPSNNCDPAADFSVGEEMLGTNMRILEFEVSSNNPHVIRIKIAYGPNDLLTTYNDSGGKLPGASDPNAQCKSGIAGSSFCSVSALETVVSRRVQ